MLSSSGLVSFCSVAQDMRLRVSGLPCSPGIYCPKSQSVCFVTLETSQTSVSSSIKLNVKILTCLMEFLCRITDPNDGKASLLIRKDQSA